MEQHNNKIISKISNFTNKNSNTTTKLYIVFTILAGILTLIPISTLLLELIDSNVYINENIYIISFYIVKIIGFLIYFCILKDITKSKSIIAIIAGIFLLMSGLMYNEINSMENTGIDYIGQALGMAMIFKLCIYVYYILTFILFIAYAKKFIFKKKVIIAIIIAIILIVILIFITKGFMNYTSIREISADIPSVADFKDELTRRHLYTNEYLLFGVDNIENNIHKIDFTSDSNEKYPSYIYYGYKTKNKSKNIKKYADYLEWIIYYTNGKIYAVLGEYDDSQLFQNFYRLQIGYDGNILSEDNEIYTYNWEKNYYEEIHIEKNSVSLENLRYYYRNGTYIIVDVFKKFSSSALHNYEIIDKIDSNMLDSYANNLK